MALIYIVEDDSNIQEIEEYALKNAGHKDMADKIKAVAEEPLPPDFEYDDYPEEAPLLEIRKAF